MFECHACLRRCLTALSASASPLPKSSTSSSARTFVRASASRSVHTISRRALHHAALAIKDKDVSTLPLLASEDTGSESRPKTWSETSGKKRQQEMKDVIRGKNPKRLEVKFLQTELKYLKDPVKLADHVKHVLQGNDEEKAQALVRLSGRGMENTVCWNHLIDWQMKQGKTAKALDTYNEMKKRAQKPDNVTYTLLLRGLANFAQYPGSLGRALSLYHGMFGPNSKITPNIQHVNAVIKVCARCNDMDSVWDIVSKLPERGPMAADSWTFTTIFNNMRYQAITDQKAGDQTEAAKREMTIIKARQMWGVIVARWRQAELRIDEELVCSMGRLLLVGSRRDWDDVLSLIEQTTEIPRLSPRLGQSASSGPETSDVYSEDRRSSEVSQVDENSASGSEFDKITYEPRSKKPGTSPVPPRPRRGFYIQPHTETLHLILEACYKLSAKKPARDYWDLFTDPNSYNITPDTACIHSFLRTLRAARASAEATELITDYMPIWQIRPTPMTYRIAMRTCLRERKDPTVMEHAGLIVENMQKTLPEPDLVTLEIYIELAMASRNTETACRVVDRLEPTIVNLRSFLNFGPTYQSKKMGAEKTLTPEDRRMGTELMQRIIGCYDWILSPGNKIDGRRRSDYIEKKTRLAAFVTRYRNQWHIQKTGQRKWGPSTFDVAGCSTASDQTDAEDIEEKQEMGLEDQGEAQPKAERTTLGSGIDALDRSLSGSGGRYGSRARQSDLAEKRTASARKQFS